ncbi:MAG: ATP-binding protein [Spirochaetota bacterium]|nr:ATP-binding protein [Spirochaetota bacterium]
MEDTPVILLLGPRQAGKSTLVMSIAEASEIPYRTLDDATILSAAAADPVGFLRSLGDRAVIDEVQRVPELLIAIKAAVDSDRSAGRYILTGSSNIMTLPRISESLAGRMELHFLRPFSQGELTETRDCFIDTIFEKIPEIGGENSRSSLVSRVLRGGFPEAVTREKEKRREAWFNSFVSTILSRDVRDVASIEGLSDIPRLLSLMASRCGSLVNFSELSNSTAIPQSTLKRYMKILEILFLYQPLEAWSSNRGKRLIKSPKIHLVDTGLTAALAGVSESRVFKDNLVFGPLLESFVINELRKQMSWAEQSCRLYHYRSSSGREVDAVLETTDGRIVGIEVKAAASVKYPDFRGLQSLEEDAGDNFVHGIILYDGKLSVGFGDRLAAVPISALWEAGRSR